MPLLQLYLLTALAILLYSFIFGLKKTAKILLQTIIFFAVYTFIKYLLT